jgi:predicted nucleic-acid-binding protein
VIGLDTNVLVRYLTQDDPSQAARAAKVIDGAAAAGLFISLVVVCEIVWVLEYSYDLARNEISAALEKILQTSQFAFEDKDLLWQALADYRDGKGDVADYSIGRIAQRAGCSHTITFDKAMKGSSLFRML